LNYDTQAVYATIFIVTVLWLYKYPLLGTVGYFSSHKWVTVTEWNTLVKERDAALSTVQSLQAGFYRKVDSGTKQIKFEIANLEQPAYWDSMPVCINNRWWIQRWKWANRQKYLEGKRYVRRGKRYLWVDELDKGDEEVNPPFDWIPETEKNGHNGNGHKKNGQRYTNSNGDSKYYNPRRAADKQPKRRAVKQTPLL